jgi:ubiquitin carboxyl-terminal hydrolase 34
MYSTDLVAELRAEVTCWCKKLQEKHDQTKQDQDTGKIGFSSPGSSFSPFSSLTPPFRLISQGHELTPELDEKSLGEVGFKDLQVRRKYRLRESLVKYFMKLFEVLVKLQ